MTHCPILVAQKAQFNGWRPDHLDTCENMLFPHPEDKNATASLLRGSNMQIVYRIRNRFFI